MHNIACSPLARVFECVASHGDSEGLVQRGEVRDRKPGLGNERRDTESERCKRERQHDRDDLVRQRERATQESHALLLALPRRSRNHLGHLCRLRLGGARRGARWRRRRLLHACATQRVDQRHRAGGRRPLAASALRPQQESLPLERDGHLLLLGGPHLRSPCEAADERRVVGRRRRVLGL